MITLNTPSAPDAAEEILQSTSLDDFSERWERVMSDIPSGFEEEFSGAVVDYLITTGKELGAFLQSLPT